MKGVENLPPDCLQSIFNHLSESEWKTVSLVCKEFLTNMNLLKQSLKVIHPKVSILSAHLKRFTVLKRIDLRYYDGDINEAILEIARFGIGLEALDISCQEPIKSETLIELGSHSKNLKVLNFYSLGRLQDNDLVLIANSFSNLEELKISYNPRETLSSPQSPTNYGVEFLASKLKLLKKIDLSGKHTFSDRSLVALSLSCAFLKDVSICCSSHGVTENGIGLLLRNRPNLEALSIGFIKMNSSQSTITIENSISYAKALTSLEFIEMDVSDILLDAIAKAKLRLKIFGLKFCKNFKVTSLLKVFSNHLTELSVVGSIVDEGMELLLNGDLSKLTHIEMSCEMTKSSLFLLSTKCPSLIEMRMYSNPVLDLDVHDELGFLFPNLRVLDLSFVFQISSKAVEVVLKSCKFLRKLILTGYRERKVTEVDNSEIPEVNLEELTISHSFIDDEGLAVIAKICPRLKFLDLSHSENVTDEGLKQIVRNIKTLNCLYIRSNRMYLCNRDLLHWMLSTGNLASLKRIYVGPWFDEEQKLKDEFLQRGCLVLYW